MTSRITVRPTPREALGRLAALVENALSYQRDAFDAPPYVNAEVSGADLVDWFSRWRENAKVALRDAKRATPARRRVRPHTRRRA